MPRSVSAALQIELSKVVTRVGYLLSVNAAPALRWCNLETVNWNGMVFVDYGFEVSGVGGSVDGPAAAVLSVQNLDNAVAAAFAVIDVTTTTVDLWQVAPAATATADVVKLGRYLLGPMQIELERLTVRLIPENSLDAFSPRRRVDQANGFFYALPEYSKIPWESEVYVVGSDRG